MRKSTLFISAVLTTFVMAMLAGVASAYQTVVNKQQAELEQQQQRAQEPQTVVVADTAPEPVPTEAQPVNWTPEQAAALAAQVLGHDDLFSIEVTDLNGETVYLVTFSSGDLVYVSMDGQIRSIGKVEVETVIVNTGRGGGGEGSVSNSQRGGDDHDDDHEEYEEHDEHEEHDDDD